MLPWQSNRPIPKQSIQKKNPLDLILMLEKAIHTNISRKNAIRKAL